MRLGKDEAGIKRLQNWTQNRKSLGGEGNNYEGCYTSYHQRLTHIIAKIPGNLGTQHSPVLQAMGVGLGR